jgi:hypothetical protein
VSRRPNEEVIADLLAMAGASPAAAERGAAFNRAWDKLIADKMDAQKAAELLLAAQMKGDDVEAFADHLLKLRAAFNGRDRGQSE